MAEYISIQEYAERFGVHENTVRRQIDKGELEHTKVGRVFRIKVPAPGEEALEAEFPEGGKEKLEQLEYQVRLHRLQADDEEQLARLAKAEKEKKLASGEVMGMKDIEATKAMLEEREKELEDFSQSLLATKNNLDEQQVKLQGQQQELKKEVAENKDFGETLTEVWGMLQDDLETLQNMSLSLCVPCRNKLISSKDLKLKESVYSGAERIKEKKSKKSRRVKGG